MKNNTNSPLLLYKIKAILWLCIFIPPLQLFSASMLLLTLSFTNGLSITRLLFLKMSRAILIK